MNVQIEIVRKGTTDNYTCGFYQIEHGSYLYLYKNSCTVSPTALLEIVPIHSSDIVSINFNYGV